MPHGHPANMNNRPVTNQSDFEKLLANVEMVIRRMTWKRQPLDDAHMNITASFLGELDEGEREVAGKKYPAKVWRSTVCTWKDGPLSGADGVVSDVAGGLIVKLPPRLIDLALMLAKQNQPGPPLVP